MQRVQEEDSFGTLIRNEGVKTAFSQLKSFLDSHNLYDFKELIKLSREPLQILSGLGALYSRLGIVCNKLKIETPLFETPLFFSFVGPRYVDRKNRKN